MHTVPDYATDVSVQFTCPRYTTSYMSTVDWSSYFVEFATRPDLGPDGTLATAYEVSFAGAFPTDAAETQCRSSLSGVVASTPGTYYWQVQRVDCDAPNCMVTGPVWHFSTQRSAPQPPSPPPPPPPPSPACGDGFDNDHDRQVDLDDWGCNSRFDRSERLTRTPTLHQGEAVRLLKRALSRRFNGSYRHGYGKRHRCGRSSRTAFACRVSWVIGDSSYLGPARISLRRRGERVFWFYSWRIKGIDEYCLATGGHHCTRTYRS